MTMSERLQKLVKESAKAYDRKKKRREQHKSLGYRIADRLINQYLFEIVVYPSDSPIEPKDFKVQRTRAGHWQRSEGAWSWTLESAAPDLEIREDIGSPYPASEVIKWKKWIFNYRHGLEINPGEEE
jgi:hypothetical protein